MATVKARVEALEASKPTEATISVITLVKLTELGDEPQTPIGYSNGEVTLFLQPDESQDELVERLKAVTRLDGLVPIFGALYGD